MITLSDIHNYYKQRIGEVIRFANEFGSGDLWAFVMSASFIDYLVKLVNNKESSAQLYKEFVRIYLSEINPLYRDFVFNSGHQDLPEQMYHVLRCGMIHSYSLVPDSKSLTKGGRVRSILLVHRKNGYTHFDKYSDNNLDSVLFTVEDFAEDLEKVLDKIFLDLAPNDPALSTNILVWVTTQPPIAQIG